MTNRKHLLNLAKNNCFLFDTGDAASTLGRANLPYGIAKILYLQEAFGFPTDASFISSYDFTITRNIARWEAGFAYGGRIDWTGDFIPLELRPNACGVLVAGLNKSPDLRKLERKCRKLALQNPTLDGINIEWDFGTSNHFINVYKVDEPGSVSGYENLLMIHGSGKELRGPNKHGFGLYLENNQQLASITERTVTPFGPITILQNEDAKAFYEYYAFVEKFSKKRREFYVNLLYPEAHVLFNETHQGLMSPNTMFLGAYHVQPHVDWYPLTLRDTLDAYLLKPGQIYSLNSLETNGLEEQAKRTELTNRLLNADVIAHGGGYRLKGIDGFRLNDHGDKRSYTIFPDSTEVTHMRAMDFEYRDSEVLRPMIQSGIIEIVSSLKPLISIKVITKSKKK